MVQRLLLLFCVVAAVIVAVVAAVAVAVAVAVTSSRIVPMFQIVRVEAYPVRA